MEPSRHELVAHTAELALRLYATTPEGLLVEACRALGILLRDETGAGETAARETCTITVEAVDREALLVDVLNELIYRAEAEGWAPLEARVLEGAPTRVTLEVTGVRLPAAPSRIKSATHHGVALRATARGWTTEVIFDV